MNDPSMVMAAVRAEFGKVLAALDQHRDELAKIPGLATVRPGYAISGDTKTPALVLAFHPGERPPDVAALSTEYGVVVRAAVATPVEQLRGAERASFVSPLLSLLDPTDAPSFAPPKRGTYVPPDAPTLETIDEEMTVTLCASPDAGWPVLRDFLAEGVQERLTVAMYDFTAHHVEDALVDALDGTDATFRLVLDGKTASGGVGGTGINGPDSLEVDVMKRLRKKLKDRFELARASVGAQGAVPMAYHIKVACVDDERIWLSSGNWQSSNLAPFDYAVAGDEPPLPVGRYNRDYHVVAHNSTLAKMYAGFIEYDATLGGDYGGPEAEPEPMLLVPEDDAPPAFAAKKRFKPVTIQDRIRVTPLLTPDNFPLFVNERLANAKKRIWIQNQYIQPKDEGDNFPEFDELVALLGKKGKKANFDLRLCLRGVTESDRDALFAAGVRPSQIRRQSNCHAKLIIVDDTVVIVGSQNMSNLGYVANRDASLAFEHAGVIEYFANVFEEDWDHASSTADADDFGVRLAPDGPAPEGFVKVPWSSVFGSPPPSAAAPTPKPAADAPAPNTDDADAIPFFGVDEMGKRSFASVTQIATALRANPKAVDEGAAKLGAVQATPAYSLPVGASSESLDEMGWAVVWGPGVGADVKKALQPLLDHRRKEVNDDTLFHELTYVAGQSVPDFLAARGSYFGDVNPKKLAYYVLLVGNPEQIPFSFQSLLDGEYRVGRLDLPDAAAYTRYVDTVLAAETTELPARDRVLHAFGPAHDGDAPTSLSVEVLVRAAQSWLDEAKKVRDKNRLTTRIDARDAATKAKLLEILGGKAGRPEVLFTASHGLMVNRNSARLHTDQGALVTAEWDGLSPIDATCLFGAADVSADADVAGLVAFLFACFGAGTPKTEIFPNAAQELAPAPFVSALPRALLAHPRGSALGVFGHVDRTLTWSLQPPNKPVATGPFTHAVLTVLNGGRLGGALDGLNIRSAQLANVVATDLRAQGAPIDDRALVRNWTEQRDAASFVLLGDPAARLRR